MYTGRNNSDLPESWIEASKVICCGHLLGLISCGAALVWLRADAADPYWLRTSALLFTLGIVSSLPAFLSMRSVQPYRSEPSQESTPHGIETSDLDEARAKRLVIACLLTISSAVVFFSSCAVAIMAFVLN